MPRATAVVPGKNGAKTEYEGVLAKARDGYQVVFGLAEVAPELANEPILVAGTRDGKPLPDSQGSFRLICPNDKEGARSVKMLEEIVVVRLRE